MRPQKPALCKADICKRTICASFQVSLSKTGSTLWCRGRFERETAAKTGLCGSELCCITSGCLLRFVGPPKETLDGNHAERARERQGEGEGETGGEEVGMDYVGEGQCKDGLPMTLNPEAGSELQRGGTG